MTEEAKSADLVEGIGAHEGGAPGSGREDRPGRALTAAGAPGGAVRGALPADAATGKRFAPTRGPGRPKGSRNIRTEETARQLVETFGDPLEADVAIGTMELGELITELRCIASDRGLKLGMTIGDIVKWQAECRRNAMPYIHAKRATVDEQGETVTPMIVFGQFNSVSAGRGRSIEEDQSNQGVIDHDDSTSHEKTSHDKPSR